MYKNWTFVVIKVISDIAVVNLSFLSGYMIRFGLSSPASVPMVIYSKVIIFITLTWLVIFNLAGMYKMQSDKTVRIDNPFLVSTAVFSSVFFTYAMVFSMYREAFYSKEVILYSSVIALLLINVSRATIWRIFKKM
ncbi:MAG: hypothetical protein WC527_06820 [Candidatus Margulisiibacteriota bacterium]